MTNSDDKHLNHLAIIMDGNGRWAKKRFLPRVAGHKQGMENVKTITKAANRLGIKVLTLYAFSTENWSRPTEEVNYLMRLPIDFFDKFMPDLMAENVRVNVMGFLGELPEKTRQVTERAMETTKNNTGLILNFALNYGSRREIVAATKQLAEQVEAGTLKATDIDEQKVAEQMMTANLGDFADPDLLIRTSGEQRISNFLLWQLAYTEMIFTDKFWPDFTTDDLNDMVDDFMGRDRRFGGVKDK
ncbi:Di-trans,poly-cis-decaprenylcistransferase [Amylolactobacillus amylotrophicus DSM 20534]|uniref:Isoprenyl transferase n=3 Tax=Amylolactobacillus TaxID=2767876 RepID=A0A0R1YKB5_9LACO|nr:MULTISPECIES: isoprenyl transferase [Amylolactobacillus]APT17873.1 isoprenyl transferase [Amylolactobacillus amylophilus DSM 20533 = JCM 1125]KRK38421.1 Di-trans,poly-cis-decaprenylcistransferase [Amylolactobacillus amylotrophicus DSM 20534]KRM42936.1 Di-trans,poly-cis-decaprenylcistransferase [Amylolactobacillus amylophilus DSM 20533 = JCM 1125]GED79802.1 isoprenyl transferase [Amylolactobacillus amylophilus]